MTPSELIRHYKENNPKGHFFDKATLSFFGERVSEMRVYKTKVLANNGYPKEVWKLVSFQRNNPFKPCYAVHYFDTENYHEFTDFKFEM